MLTLALPWQIQILRLDHQGATRARPTVLVLVLVLVLLLAAGCGLTELTQSLRRYGTRMVLISVRM